MLERGEGVIVNISSTEGIVALEGEAAGRGHRQG